MDRIVTKYDNYRSIKKISIGRHCSVTADVRFINKTAIRAFQRTRLRRHLTDGYNQPAVNVAKPALYGKEDWLDAWFKVWNGFETRPISLTEQPVCCNIYICHAIGFILSPQSEWCRFPLVENMGKRLENNSRREQKRCWQGYVTVIR